MKYAMNSEPQSSFVRLKPVLFVLCLLPFARWIVLAIAGELGIDPARFLGQSSGLTTLTFLCLTLLITPLRVILKQPDLLRWRRILGLFTFFYACVHAIFWFWLDRRLNFSLVGVGLAERPAIWLGVLNLILLGVLAATSTQGMVRKLGRNWRRLHRLVYVIALIAILHMYLMQEPGAEMGATLVAFLVVAALLLWRVFYAWKQARGVKATFDNIKPH